MKLRLLPLIFVFFVFHNLQAETFVPKSDLIYKVLKIVDRLYVDQKRVAPQKMLEGSLEQLSLRIAPVLIKSEHDGRQARLHVSVDQFNKTFQFQLPDNINQLNDILQEISRFIKPRLEKVEKPKMVDYAIINGFLKKLDPHSSLLIPEVYSEFSTQTSGNFGGLGITIGVRNGKLTIISPINNTPAYQAGLKANDHIAQINEESTINMSLTEAVKKLRGKPKTKVNLHILRKGLTSPRKYTIIRDIIKITSVKTRVFKEGGKRVGLIKINTFQQNTMNEINSCLEDMDYNLNDFQGLIIDLRNNPGGLLIQAIKISDHFMDKGVIVSTAGLKSRPPKPYKAQWWDRDIVDIPILVLVNGGSASASEIVAAALKKNKRALLLGLRTFGKGSVQQLIPFKEGSALRLTTSKYLTPGDISIQSVGVAPNIEVAPISASSDHIYINLSKTNRSEKNLEENFAEWGDKAEPPDKTIFYIHEPGKEELEEEELEEEDAEKRDSKQKDSEKKDSKQKSDDLKKDFLTRTAVEILIRNNKKDYDHLFQTALESTQILEKEQERKLIDKLASFSPPVDWNPGEPAREEKIASKSWLEIKSVVKGREIWRKHSSDSISPDDELRLYLEAKNIGKNRISRLMAVTESKNPVFDDRQFIFGKLEPGKSAKWSVPIKIPKASLSSASLIDFSFLNQQKKKIHTNSIRFNIKEKNRPGFRYELQILDNGQHGSKGDGDGIIETGETIALKVSIFNQGKGKSGALTILLKNGEGKDIFLTKGRVNLESLPPGKTKADFFKFDLKKAPEDGDLDFSIDVFDGSFYLTSINQKLKIPLGRKVDKIVNSAPDIDLSPHPLTTRRKTYKLKGVIKDNNKVKDVYVFNDRKKIYYKNFQKLARRDQVKFSLDINLEKDGNKIVIVSRDNENVSARKEIRVSLQK